MLYKRFGKPLLFRLDAELAHHWVMDGLRLFQSFPGGVNFLENVYGVEHSSMWGQQYFGLTFSRPIGLAAGLDKNAQVVKALSAFGFGFMEVGTVTPQPQLGNEKPRLFRLPDDCALINRMGFNNVGMAQMKENLSRIALRKIPIAINIGRNKLTPQEKAESDYRSCIQGLYPHADFFVLNISSPNTPGLRNLQQGDSLHRLLQSVQEEIEIQTQLYPGNSKPVLVKLSPDLERQELVSTVRVIQKNHVAGIIATNTTLDRQGLIHTYKKEVGGLSGKPLQHMSTEMIRTIYQITEGTLPIIGCGGIFTAQDAYQKIRAGASLLEIYTALIYEGPEIVRRLHEELQKLLEKDGFHHISQAIGADHT